MSKESDKTDLLGIVVEVEFVYIQRKDQLKLHNKFIVVILIPLELMFISAKVFASDQRRIPVPTTSVKYDPSFLVHVIQEKITQLRSLQLDIKNANKKRDADGESSMNENISLKASEFIQNLEKEIELNRNKPEVLMGTVSKSLDYVYEIKSEFRRLISQSQ